MECLIKSQKLSGALFLGAYKCGECGPFELITERGEDGHPPAFVTCKCGQYSPRVITGAPSVRILFGAAR